MMSPVLAMAVSGGPLTATTDASRVPYSVFNVILGCQWRLWPVLIGNIRCILSAWPSLDLLTVKLLLLAWIFIHLILLSLHGLILLQLSAVHLLVTTLEVMIIVSTHLHWRTLHWDRADLDQVLHITTLMSVAHTISHYSTELLTRRIWGRWLLKLELKVCENAIKVDWVELNRHLDSWILLEVDHGRRLWLDHTTLLDTLAFFHGYFLAVKDHEW